MNSVGIIISNTLYLSFKYLSDYVSERSLNRWSKIAHPEDSRVKLYRYDELKEKIKAALPSYEELVARVTATEQIEKQKEEHISRASLPTQWATYYKGADEKWYQEQFNVNYDPEKGNRAAQMAMCMAMLRFLAANRIKSVRIANTGIEKMEDLVQSVCDFLKSNDYYGLPHSYERLRRKFYDYLATSGTEADERMVIVSGKYGNDCAKKFDEVHMAVLKEVFLKSNKPDMTRSWKEYVGIMQHEYNQEPVKLNRFKQICTSSEIEVLAARCREGSSYYETVIRPFHLRKSPEYSLSLIAGDGWVPGRAVKHMFKGKEVVSGMNVWYWYDWKSGAILSWRISHAENSHDIRQSFRDILNIHNVTPRSVMLDKKWEEQPDLKRMFTKASVSVQTKRAYNPKSNKIERQNKEVNKMHRLFDELWVNMTPGVSRQNRHNDEALRGAKPMEYEEFEAMIVGIFNQHNNTVQAQLGGNTPIEVLRKHINPECLTYDFHERLWIFGDRLQRPVTVRNMRIQFSIASRKYEYLIPDDSMVDFIKRNVKYGKVKVYYDEKYMETVDIYQFQDEEDDTCDRFLCTCVNAENFRYNVAQVEQTDEDKRRIGAQQRRGKVIDDFVKRELEEKEEILEATNFDRASVYSVTQEEYKQANATDIAKMYRNYYSDIEETESKNLVPVPVASTSNKEKLKQLRKQADQSF